MVTLFYDDFDKICRGCLCKTGEMRPIFGSSLDNMLSNVADINVSNLFVKLLFIPIEQQF